MSDFIPNSHAIPRPIINSLGNSDEQGVEELGSLNNVLLFDDINKRALREVATGDMSARHAFDSTPASHLRPFPLESRERSLRKVVRLRLLLLRHLDGVHLLYGVSSCVAEHGQGRIGATRTTVAAG